MDETSRENWDKTGTFRDIGQEISNGQLLGNVGNVEIHSPFSGELMGWIAIPEERLTASQPVAWLRVT